MLSTVKHLLKFQVRYVARRPNAIPKANAPNKVDTSVVPKESNVQVIRKVEDTKVPALLDFEVHAQLRSLGKLHEQFLEKELQKKLPSPEVFTRIIKELPTMMTPSIVNICDICSKHSKLTKPLQELWTALEISLYNRFNSMTNEHIVTVLSAFSSLNKGSPQLYKKFQDMIIEPDIPFKGRHLVSILTSFCQMNYGTPLFLYTVISRLKKAGKIETFDGIISNKPKIPLSDLAKAAKKLSMMKNNMYKGYGLYKVIEKRARATIAQNKFSSNELCKFVEYYLGANLGSRELQTMIEQEIVKKSTDIQISGFIKILSALSHYKIKTKELSKIIEELTKKWLTEFTDTQLPILIKAYTSNKTLERTNEVDMMIVKSAIERVVAFKSRVLATIAEGFADGKCGVPKELKNKLYNEIEKSARSKLAKFVTHDLIQLQKGFEKAKMGSYTFHAEILSEIWRQVNFFKYKDCIQFIHILRNFPDEWNSILDIKLWKVITQKLKSVIDKCTLDDCAKILEVCRLANLPSNDLVPRIINRLENDVQGLTAVGFCIALKYLVEFKATNLHKYEHALKLLMQSEEKNKYSKRFGPNEIISILHSVLVYNEELFRELVGDVKDLLEEYLGNADIKSYREYVKVMCEIKELPKLLVVECKATEDFDDLYLLIEEHKKDLESKNFTIIINNIDRRLNIGEIVILDEEKKVRLLILCNGKEEYMGHNPDELYKSAEVNENDYKGKVVQVKDRSKIKEIICHLNNN